MLPVVLRDWRGFSCPPVGLVIRCRAAGRGDTGSAQTSHREVAMTITVPWIWIEAAIGIGCCALAGCVLGLVVTGARIVGERHGS